MKRWITVRFLLSIVSIIAATSLIFAYLAPFVHPKTVSWLPFFGLGYGIIISFNLLLLVLWTFLRSRWAFLFLGIIALGGKLHFRTFAFGSQSESVPGTSFHIMSYNVRLFDLYNTINNKSQETKHSIFRYLKEKDPDIVCFQEFYHQDPPTNFVTKDSLLLLLKTKDYHERYAHKMYGRQNFGIAMFSKYPMIEKGFVNFPNQDSSYNYCIYADIIKNNDTCRVYNIHLQSIRLQKDDYALFNAEEQSVAEQSSNSFKLVQKIRRAYPLRATQAALIVEHIDRSPYPVIVCGDFNDTPLSYTYNLFASRLTDAFRQTSKGLGITYAGRIPVGRIDYIFHTPTLRSHQFHLQTEPLSDHYAIDCQITIPSQK